MGALKSSLGKFSAACAFGALLAGSTMAMAADLPSVKEPVPVAPVVDNFEPFFIKIGVTYELNTSTSRLAGQNPILMQGGNFGVYPAGVGATIGNIVTLGGEAGYFVTRNISLDVSAGIPFYAKDTTKGFNPRNPALPNGTVLSEILPAVVPITVVYHLNQFGAFQPYAGVGLAPGFSFDNKNEFLTGVKVGGSVGLVLQAGADYMFDRNWGVSFDAKKIFSYVDAHATGLALAPGVPVITTQHVNFQPWLLSAGIVYRFGAPDAVTAKY